jgi:hypothetical protein
VPKAYLIPLSGFQSKEDIGRFIDVAPAAGLNVMREAGGLAIDDFENNGLLDIVVSSMETCDPIKYFHNNGDGTFTDRTAQTGLADQLGALNIMQVDYNNDGCMDLFIPRGGWEYPQRRSLLRNNCDGTFTDVTEASGLVITWLKQIPRYGLTLITTAILTSSLPTKTPPANCFTTRATAHLKTSRIRRESIRQRFPKE